MKKLESAAIALACLVAVNAAAQVPEKSSTEATKQTGSGPVVKTRTETVTGTVKEYDAGKRIKLSGPNGKTFSFSLDENARVDGSIVIGQMAKVTLQKRSDGTEHVAVVSEATREAQQDASAPKVYSQSTVKQSGPGLDSKSKSEVVIGIVKEYEPGKKITVAGPNSKDHSFDLDEQVSMKGTVNVGVRVRIIFTRTDDGQRVTTIEPFHKS